MIIHVDKVRTQTGVKKGLEYQLYGDGDEPRGTIRGTIYRGNPDLVKEWARTSNSKTAKAFSILVSFAESKKELERKLAERGKSIDDLLSDIEALLFNGYKFDELSYTAIAHSDTDNFHFHIYVANNFAGTGKALKLWWTSQELRDIRRYIDLKYGLSSPEDRRQGFLSRPIGSLKWEDFIAKGRNEMREKIHEKVMEGIKYGYVRDRQSLIDFIENKLKLKVRRQGKDYISVDIQGKLKIRLKGTIYREDFKVGTEEKREKLNEVVNRLRHYTEKRKKVIEKTYRKDREKLTTMSIEARVEARERKQVVKVGDRRERQRLAKRRYKTYIDISLEQVSKQLKLQEERRRKAEALAREAERIKREVDLRKLMSFLNIDYYHGNGYILARVPWRKDANPSFIAHYREGKWLWYDLARQEGGSVIDFVMKFFSADFPKALNYLQRHAKEIANSPEKGIKLGKEITQRITNIRNPDKQIAQIWKLRHIPRWLKIADRSVIRHKIRIGKHGEPEGFEIERQEPLPVLVFTDGKNPRYWRSVIPSKSEKSWLTKNEPILLKHGKTSRLYIVEGYTDALAIYQIDPEADIVVLGTIQNAEKIPSDLANRYEEIYIATDNDEAGELAYSRLKKILPAAERLEYEGKDPMEAWLEGELGVENEEWEDYEEWEEDYEEERRKDEGTDFRPGM